MWENFKLGKISENRNKNVKCNTVTYPLKLPCQWSFVTHSLFPIILLFALQVLHQTRTRTSHVARTREDTILSFLWNCFSWPLHYICRKTRKFFFMTIAYAEKLGNFKELIICVIRYIKYLVEKQGCKSWILNPISLNHSLCFVLLWCVCLTLLHYFVL